MRRQLLAIAALACAGGSCGPNTARVAVPDWVAGTCFALVTHGSAPSGNTEPIVGDGIANDSLVVFLARVSGADSLSKGPVRYPVRDSLPEPRGPADWHQDAPDSLSLYWGQWPNLFVVETVRKPSGFAGRAYYKDDAECGKEHPASHCWRGTAELSPIPCGGLPRPLAGEWLGLLSYGGMSDDTILIGRAGSPASRWVLTLRENGTFTSRRGDATSAQGIVVLSRDTVAANRIALLTFSTGPWDPLYAEFYPELRGDTLTLRNAWSDAYDYVFVRRR